MYGELFKSLTGVNMMHVPYRGGGPAATDLLGGQVQAYFSTMPSSIEYIRAGRLRALAVNGERRADVLPDVPTVGEFVPGYEATTWWGICAPKNTPANIIEKLHREINTGLADPGMKARIDTVFPSSPTDFRKLILDDTEKWSRVIRAGNIRVD
jgi:tripartite-type tricarboxylate transporter receptor subunit TctC